MRMRPDRPWGYRVPAIFESGLRRRCGRKNVRRLPLAKGAWIGTIMNSGRFADLPPHQTRTALLDECAYPNHRHTMNRKRSEHREAVERRNQRIPPHSIYPNC